MRRIINFVIPCIKLEESFDIFSTALDHFEFVTPSDPSKEEAKWTEIDFIQSKLQKFKNKVLKIVISDQSILRFKYKS